MDKDVKQMTREELEMEVAYLRNKYIWGLQPEDFAAAVISENDYVSENKVVYTEEMSDDDLRAKLFNNHHGIFTIENWTEYVRYYAQERFTKEDWNVIETMKQRKLI